MPFVRAAYDLLAADAQLAALLPAYQGGKALFRGQLAPDDTPYPFLVVRYVSQIDAETFRERGAQVIIDVAVYDEFDAGTTATESIMARVLSVLNRARLTPVGHDQGTISVSSIVAAPYESGITGRVATFEARALETA